MKNYRLNKGKVFIVILLLILFAVSAYGAPPKVIETIPEAGQSDVDPRLREIRVVFDQDMSTDGFSICGGGPQFPKLIGKPRWINSRTLVMRVRFQPEHSYQMSVNCPSAKNCCSINGEAATPYPLRFKTTTIKGARKAKSDKAKAPKVIETIPENGARNVDPNLQEIRVVFDEDMTTGRSFSICGGGPKFPDIIGNPEWIDGKTFVMKVKLRPQYEYRFSINCPSAKNFRSVGGVPAEPYPVSFRTGDGGVEKEPKKLTVSDNIKAISQLNRFVNRNYSYRDLRSVDWDKLFSENYEPLKSAQTAEQFAEIAAKLLGAAKDKHIWLYVGNQRFATYVKPVTANAGFSRLEKLIPQWQKRSGVVYTGRFEDGIGYIRIDSWGRDKEQALEQAFVALWEFSDAPGLIIDVRGNGGGSEPLAQQFAGCFLDEPRLYAQHVFCDAAKPGGFTELQNRMLEPNKKRPKYRGKVAVLSGPVVMSSCEAFILMMKQVPGCKLVGLPTQGSSGNPKSYELSNGVTVYLPSWKAMRPDGTCFEGEGIKPDILVEADEFEFVSKDPVVEAALKYLREN